MGFLLKESNDFLQEVPVSFEDWDSGKVKLTDELFRACYTAVPNVADGFRLKLAGYRGETTGTLLGPWFAEVCEPVNIYKEN